MQSVITSHACVAPRLVVAAYVKIRLTPHLRRALVCFVLTLCMCNYLCLCVYFGEACSDILPERAMKNCGLIVYTFFHHINSDKDLNLYSFNKALSF